MLKGASDAFDLPRLGGPAQLPSQLVALRKAGRAERMSFRQKPAGGIGDDLAAIGVVFVGDKPLRFAFPAEAEAS